jgi:hypothetical protein
MNRVQEQAALEKAKRELKERQAKEAKEQAKHPQFEPEPCQSERLRQHFHSRFGSDWRRGITITVRADQLSWFVRMIERGIEAQKAAWLADSTPQLDGAQTASIASWRLDLDDLVNRIIATSPPARKRKGK